tara:strand:- start:1176 stop:1412 length:237 start_codon:yes stop_codon:yes gene_type:complete
LKEEDIAPDIRTCTWLVEAFTELSTCRQIGMALGPIPLTAIQDYTDRHQMGDLFIRQIMAIDRAYLSEQNDDKKVRAN